MGHRDFKTTLIYADYSPSGGEADLVDAAFGTESRSGGNPGGMLRTDQANSDQLNPTESEVST